MISIIKRNQQGMTLVEIVVAGAIIAAPTRASSTIILSMLHHTAGSTAPVTAATSIEDAAHRISKDGQMAQNTDLLPDNPVNSITLSWTDPANSDNYAVSYVLVGNKLQRQETINLGTPTTQAVAISIDSIEFYQPLGTTDFFTAKITSSGNSASVNETREYHILLRASN